MKLSIAICTLDTDNYEMLPQCLKSIKEHTSHIDYEIVVADNGSNPRGYVHPMNQALYACEGDILIAFNDDIICTPGWIDPLIKEAESGTWVSFPDQESTDGLQRICGWCIVFSREGFEELQGFDETFDLWCGDIDLAKRLDVGGRPAVRVALPTPLIHQHGGTQTIGDQGFREYMNPTGQQDIQKYVEKWGEDPNQYKFLREDESKWKQ